MPNQPHSVQPKFFAALTTLATCGLTLLSLRLDDTREEHL